MITIKAEELKTRMIHEGFTGAGLAKATNITQGYICQILNGKRAIRPPTAKKICDVLNCKFDDIFRIAGQEQHHA